MLFMLLFGGLFGLAGVAVQLVLHGYTGAGGALLVVTAVAGLYSGWKIVRG